MALAPLAGKQVFETGIETEWLKHDTVEIRAHSHADWPLNALDDAALPAKQHQMVFEHAILHIEPHGEKANSRELRTADTGVDVPAVRSDHTARRLARMADPADARTDRRHRADEPGGHGGARGLDADAGHGGTARCRASA